MKKPSISRLLDEIYERLDILLFDGEFAKVDDILSNVPVDIERVEILLGYLTITAQWEGYLLERLPLLDKIIDRVEHEFPAERAKAMLRGFRTS